MKLLFLIPAFNEEKMIGNVIKNLPKKILGISQVDAVVIDDGSADNTALEAKRANATVLHHIINRGLGATLATGFTYAKKKNYDFVVTFDGDGQHAPQDIKPLLQPLLTDVSDVVIGSRLLKASAMPLIRKIVNYLSNVITWLLFSTWTTDSQSGLRAFNKYALSKIKIKSQRMEVSSEIFKEISRLKLRVVEIPSTTIYTNYSLQKGQRVSNAPNVLIKLLLHRFSS